MEETDVALVGAGPIGIELAVALKRAGLEYTHIEARQIGATVEWYAPGTTFFSSPERIALCGVPLEVPNQLKATREHYLSYLRGLVRQFGLRIRTYTRVSAAERRGDHFILSLESTLGGGKLPILAARRLVFAIGDMHAPRRLGIPGEDLPHVSHYFCDPHHYFGRRVLIAGGRNSAAEAAVRLFRVGAEVTITYRATGFDSSHVKSWILPELRHLIASGMIEFLPETVPSSISPTAVEISSLTGAASRTVPADMVLLLTGYQQDPSLYQMLGVELRGEGRRPVFDPSTMMTGVPGLFVAGTGAAGTQLSGFKEFIETSHVHVPRIISALTGQHRKPEAPPRDEALLES